MWENEKMEKLHWSQREIAGYLESLILSGVNTEDEEYLYQDYNWYGRFDKSSETYRKLVHKIKREWNGG